MRVGIVAATQFEIEPARRFVEQLPADFPHRFAVVLTGVGMLPTTYQLLEQIGQQPFDLLLQAGIGGGFSEKFSLAEVVLVQDEVIGDLGVEEEEFKDVFDMGFAAADGFPFHGKRLVNPFISRWNKLSLPLARGLTINEITTRPARIEALQQKYGCEVESMEGAAFHYVCLQKNIPFLQLRAVSNRVGERSKKNWKIKESIESLNKQLIRIIEQITEL
ncbi:MAG: futalosine hydrolase [Williamsia sp.]|nr:futalosine hydrolase [Williamsia sp.]